MARALFIVALIGAICAGVQGSRSLLQAPQPAPAPQSTINGAAAYNCPTPGSTGYLFQTAPCRFGPYAGMAVYCDQSQEGNGIVGIRNDSSGNCTTTADCGNGQFCSAQTQNNGTCTPAADVLCFAGSLAPNPAPAPAPSASIGGAGAPVPSLPALTMSATPPDASSGSGADSSGDAATAAAPATG